MASWTIARAVTRGSSVVGVPPVTVDVFCAFYRRRVGDRGPNRRRRRRVAADFGEKRRRGRARVTRFVPLPVERTRRDRRRSC